MKLSNRGYELLKNFEGIRLKAYQDVVGVWTIGYGSTRHQNDQPVKKGDQLLDKTEADALFTKTIGLYERSVNKAVKVPLLQNQFDALVSFTYNLGPGALAQSTLLKKLNAGDYTGAADQFLLWNKVTDRLTGKKIVNLGLTKRREQERALFLKT